MPHLPRFSQLPVYCDQYLIPELHFQYGLPYFFFYHLKEPYKITPFSSTSRICLSWDVCMCALLRPWKEINQFLNKKNIHLLLSMHKNTYALKLYTFGKMITVENKVLFLVDLKKQLGDQKIDVVFDKENKSNQFFLKTIKQKSTQLC